MSRAPESVYLKVRRAQEHHRAIEAEIEAFGKTHPYAVFPEVDEDRRQMALNFAVVSDPHVSIALSLGDCIHDYRSALDQLVYALPRVEGADPKWEGWSQFPIADGRDNFNSVRPRNLCGVSGEAVAAIEAQQPYFGRPQPEGHGLWYLRELSNLDKHRLSPIVYGVVASGSIEVPTPPTGTAHTVFNSGTLEHGATIAKVYLSDPAPPQMEVNLDLTVGITVGDLGAPDLLGLSALIERIHRAVVRAIVRVEPHIAPA